MRNDGTRPAEGVRLTDEVGPGTAVRAASGPAGACAVAPRRATCPLGSLAPGQSVTVGVRALVDDEPAARTLVQRITLSSAGRPQAADRTVSTLVDRAPAGDPVLDLPGPTVKLIAFVGFVLAARSRS